MIYSSRLQNYYSGRMAVVAGGSEGIGLAVAAELVQLGADVLIASRDPDKCARALTHLEAGRSTTKQKILTEQVDLTDFEATRAVMDSVVHRHGSPDWLIVTAGFSYPGYLSDLEMPALEEMMDVNYFGTVHAAKALLPAMQQARRGHIVNTSSVAGYLGLPGYAGYCGSKFAVIGFSWALRHELRPYGIAVSVLCPPNTRTPGLERENRIKPKAILEIEERLKTASPEEVAHAMLRALPRRPFLIHPTWDAQAVNLATRWLPTRVTDLFIHV